MVHVAGGTYIEQCHEPSWDELFGSGIRAAAQLSGLGEEVRFATVVGDDYLSCLEAMSATFRFTATAQSVPKTTLFSYEHALSTPVITPAPVPMPPQLAVNGDAVLCFGMLDAVPLIDGKVVVYDPQSPWNPRMFSESGSKATKLAIVANSGEATILTGTSDVLAAAQALRETSSAEVVVVKRGPYGCLVVSGRSVDEVPAFEATRIFPIGSGDVFSATFFHYWLSGSAPADAALKASRATALYCRSPRGLPITSAEIETSALKEMRPKTRSGMVYLAGPFFTFGQRWAIRQTRDALLGMRVPVFSPLHDVGRGSAAEVAPADLKGLDKCAVVLALVDGLDSGTIFEIGYAIAKSIPVVCLAQNESGENLTMFLGTNCVLEDDFPTAVYKAVWKSLGCG
jgi:hypothetical protein